MGFSKQQNSYNEGLNHVSSLNIRHPVASSCWDFNVSCNMSQSNIQTSKRSLNSPISISRITWGTILPMQRWQKLRQPAAGLVYVQIQKWNIAGCVGPLACGKSIWPALPTGQRGDGPSESEAVWVPLDNFSEGAKVSSLFLTFWQRCQIRSFTSLFYGLKSVHPTGSKKRVPWASIRMCLDCFPSLFDSTHSHDNNFCLVPEHWT